MNFSELLLAYLDVAQYPEGFITPLLGNLIDACTRPTKDSLWVFAQAQEDAVIDLSTKVTAAATALKNSNLQAAQIPAIYKTLLAVQ